MELNMHNMAILNNFLRSFRDYYTQRSRAHSSHTYGEGDREGRGTIAQHHQPTSPQQHSQTTHTTQYTPAHVISRLFPIVHKVQVARCLFPSPCNLVPFQACSARRPDGRVGRRRPPGIASPPPHGGSPFGRTLRVRLIGSSANYLLGR